MALLKRKRIGMNDAMSVVTKFVNACNRHDADGVGACLHPDFDSIQPMYPNRNFRGADQVRRNWQAIFDAEPGFRLTVLRSASTEDTIWLELHGAGRDAEVAGVFVMGVQGDRIRWARIYSALVEPVADAGEGAAPAPLREVRSGDGPAPAGDAAVVEEALIAPVLDIGRTGRRRRRRRGADEEGAEDEGGGVATEAPPVAEVATTEPEPAGPEAAEPASGTVAIEPDVAVVDVDPVAVVVTDAETVAVEATDAETVAVEATDAEPAEVEVEVEVVEVVKVVEVVEEAGSADAVEPEVVVVVAVDEGGGPPTEAVEMVTLTEPEPEPAAETDGEAAEADPAVAPAPEPPKRRFGKRPRP